MLIDDLIFIALLVGAMVYWWSAVGVKEIALAATKAYCQAADVQLLDDCIVINRYWFKRDETGKIRVWRSFVFEFASTGENRYGGRIIVLGSRILSIQLDPYRIENDNYPT